MGNEILPIESFKEVILSNPAPYIIVVAETGSGKSTQIPQWYREQGLKVLVTEPLIETVVGTSEYVSQLVGCEFGQEVGYRTAQEYNDSPSTEILFCTDGLVLVRELAGHNQFEVLIIDELHEWNKNQSTLEAWAWKHLEENTSMFQKVVVLSATLDAEELSKKRGNAPIFYVPGRQHEIIDQPAGESVVEDVESFVSQGFDVLVFLPGKKEIQDTISALKSVNAEVIPFHSQLEREEKDLAYQAYSRPKVVVSTNALETGRTLLPSPGRQLAVVDSGMEKRVELVNGIEGLYLKPIAKSRGLQRRGRTGRVGQGVYVDHCPASEREDYPIPEILRTRLDQTVLRLAMVGYDATELPFYHDVPIKEIIDAKRALYSLGAMDENGNVRSVGQEMSRLPLSVHYSRMVVEAKKRGVVNDVLTIAAILEAGGIVHRDSIISYLTNEDKSDFLAQLDVWELARKKNAKPDLKKLGIIPSAYFRAKKIRKALFDAVRKSFWIDTTGDRRDVMLSCVSGMVDHLYKYRGSNTYINGDSVERIKDRHSVVVVSKEWVVGFPKDIQFKNRFGELCNLHLISMVTEVDPSWLAEIAPQLVSVEEGVAPVYDHEKDSCVSTKIVSFNSQEISREQQETPEHDQAASCFADWLARQFG